MKYDIKVIFMIICLIVIVSLDGFYLVKTIRDDSTTSPVIQKKQDEVKASIRTINLAIKNMGGRKSLKINASQPPISSSSGQSSQNNPVLFTARIYNATGKSGIATSLREQLLTLNLFKDIAVGNMETASSSALKMKSSLPADIKEKILSLLKITYPAITESILEDKEAEDVILIIGTK